MISSTDVSKYYHTRFFIDSNYEKWKKGGYGTVYYDKKNSIIKKMARYNEVNNTEENNYPNYGVQPTAYYIFYPTIQEACFTKLLSKYPGFVILHSIHLSTHYLYLQEQFMGESLHRCLKDPSLDIPSLFLDILLQCLILEQNGLQHTDLKTSNLLYQPPSCTLTMIDYNCMSMKIVYEKQLVWVNSIGTWMYVAPEVACEERITNTSIVWSLGMILLCMLGAYPVHPKNYPNIVEKETISKRKSWIMILKNIFLQESEPYFASSIATVPDIYQPILSKIFYQHPEKRISLQELYTLWKDTFQLRGIEDIQTAYYHEIVVKPFVGWSPTDRTDILEQVYYFCHRWNQLYKMCSIIHILDHFSEHICKGYEHLVFVAAWNIVSCWMNQHICQHIEIYEYIENKYKIRTDDTAEMTWVICDTLQWNLYEKPADVWLVEQNQEVDYEHLVQVFIEQTKPYSMKSLVEHMTSSRG